MTATTITSNQYSTVVIDGSINPLTLEAAVAPATPAGVTANYSGADGVFSSYAGASLTLGGDGNAGSVTGGTASGGAEVGGIGVDLTAAGSVTVNDSEYYSNFIHGGSGNDGAEGGAGVSMSGGGSISVAAFSQIGGGGGDVGGTGVEVTGSALTTVTNSGTIYGGSTLDSTSFGGFGPGGTGVSLDGNATLNNSGTINGGGGGDGGTGLILSNGASATNNLAGFIQGGYGVSLGGTGVVLNAGTNLTNDGTINGGSGSGANGSTGGTGAYVGAGATLTNTYEIFGGSGASNGATGGNPGTGVYLNGGTVIDNGSANGAFDHIISGGVDPTSVKYVYNIGDAVQFGTITGSHLVLENGGTIQGDINGLKIGDSIDLANVTVAQAEAGFSENGGDTSATIALPAQYGLSTDLQLTGDFTGEVFTFTSIDGGAGTEIQLEPPCYLRGTQIRTPVADVPVEDLKVGDLVTTVSGESQPIRWLGHRSIDCMRHPNPAAVWPIRIQAGAFAHDLPARDLWVSPGHSLLVDGVLIQAHNLVNGATIVQVPRARVEYWHVELDRHDILLAEGLPAESYLDTGNRSAFLDGGAYLEAHPDFKPKHWADTCVPLVTEGAAVIRAREALIARAQALGYAMTEDPDAHVMVDGRRVEAARLSPSRMAFLLPAAGATIELRCRSFVPAHVNPASGDQRSLGICVSRLQLDGADVPLDDETVFALGWHGVERNPDGRQWRWSLDRMPLPMGTRLIVIDLDGPGFYWTQSASDVIALFG